MKEKIEEKALEAAGVNETEAKEGEEAAEKAERQIMKENVETEQEDRR